jgi:signal transduction histidine kinase/ActR/RegA family two-component response regulator
VRGPKLTSLRRQLALKAVITSGLAVVLLSAAFLAYDLGSFQDALVRRLAAEAEIVGLNSVSAMLFEDLDSANDTLAGLKADTTVKAAAIYDADGRRFATYLREVASPEPQPLPSSLSGVTGPTVNNEHDRLTLSRPIHFDGKLVGTVLVRADLSERDALLRRYAGIALSVGLGVFALAVLLSLRVQQMIMRPIVGLAETARAVSERKDYSVRAEAARVDELGPLVTTFNEMLENIQRRDARLQEASATLKRTVDERTVLYRHAREANRLKDEFLATLSHELRTPLGAIVGWTAVLAEGKADPDTKRKAILAIERNARAQTKLIEDILDVSRIVSGKIRLSVGPVDLAAVIQHAVDAVRPAADASEIQLLLVLDASAGQVVGDPDRLQQVFSNLLSNAIKFTPRGGRVHVQLWKPNSHAEVIVKDTGAGIPSEFLPHVFDRFRQADASSTRAHGGLGLGLAIVRHVVELHGGSVDVASEGEGKGATFSVRLPLVPVSGAQAAPSPGTTAIAASAVSLAGVSVLVVDDDLDSRELVAISLTRCGADVRSVPSAQAALDAIAERPPDVLLSDIEMPGEDGYALIERIRALPPERGGRVPAAALTAYARAEDKLNALQRGFQMHLAKPIGAAELATVVASLAGRTAGPPAAGGAP